MHSNTCIENGHSMHWTGTFGPFTLGPWSLWESARAIVVLRVGAARRGVVDQLKIVMALTGVVLLLYLVVHMIGNLKIFFGEEALDTHAHWLRLVGEAGAAW